MARLLADEDFPLPTVAILRRLGHDVYSVQSLGLASIKLQDAQVLQLSISLQRTVMTMNRGDFRRLHRVTDFHYGIITCSHTANFKELASRIDALLESADVTGRIHHITRPQQ